MVLYSLLYWTVQSVEYDSVQLVVEYGTVQFVILDCTIKYDTVQLVVDCKACIVVNVML